MAKLSRAIALLILLSGCCLGTRSSFQANPPEARLVQLMTQRLAIADEVAWIKYTSQLPVRDAKREAEVLAQLTTLASQSGLSEATAQRFFLAQIKASRTQQEYDIRRWKSGATLPATPPKNLKTDIRPKIDAVDQELIGTLAKVSQPRAGLASFVESALRAGGTCRTAAGISASPLH
jgi:chorismate mutase